MYEQRTPRLTEFHEWAAITSNMQPSDLTVSFIKRVHNFPPDAALLIQNSNSYSLFVTICSRVFKFCYVGYRDAEIQEGPSDELVVKWMNVFSRVQNAVNIILKYNMSNLIMEAMSVAMQSVVQNAVLMHCECLANPTMFLAIIRDTEFAVDFMKFMHSSFECIGSIVKIFATKCFIHQMTERCYDLVVLQYPTTKMALIQLMRAMKALQWYGRNQFIDYLINNISQRLLKTGVSTKSILNSYANIIEGLIFFDPSFVLVHKVCQVVKDYLRTRPDSIKNIIRFIFVERPGGNQTNVNSILFTGEELAHLNDEQVMACEESHKRSWMKWNPDPYDANPYESRLVRLSADVFSMLVMIYGSKDMFVKEYRETLAQRMLTYGWKEKFDDEKHYISMMKSRFHDGELSQCEVMLRDIIKSLEFCKEFNGKLDNRTISYVYWPDQDDDDNVLFPEYIEEIKSKLDKLYSSKNDHRTLQWFNTFGGAIELQLQMGSVSIKVEVPMAHYLVISQFLERESMPLSELSTATGLSTSRLTDVVNWWAERGCLLLINNQITLVEDEKSWLKLQKEADDQQSKLSGPVDNDEDSEEEMDLDNEEQQTSRVDELEAFWAYTRSLIITSKGPAQLQAQQVTAERLLGIFKILCSPGKPPTTLQEVVAFMNRKIKAQLVYLENGVYKPTAQLEEEAKLAKR